MSLDCKTVHTLCFDIYLAFEDRSNVFAKNTAVLQATVTRFYFILFCSAGIVIRVSGRIQRFVKLDIRFISMREKRQHLRIDKN